MCRMGDVAALGQEPNHGSFDEDTTESHGLEWKSRTKPDTRALVLRLQDHHERCCDYYYCSLLIRSTEQPVLETVKSEKEVARVVSKQP